MQFLNRTCFALEINSRFCKQPPILCVIFYEITTTSIIVISKISRAREKKYPESNPILKNKQVVFVFLTFQKKQKGCFSTQKTYLIKRILENGNVKYIIICKRLACFLQVDCNRPVPCPMPCPIVVLQMFFNMVFIHRYYQVT